MQLPLIKINDLVNYMYIFTPKTENDFTKNILRLETNNISHETNGKADLRTRSGIASEHLFFSSHCRFVVRIQ